ncbi:GNAT family N-acetyltransferase [Hymenobacter psychrophilus]|uniref:Protein N-acetyltransferase, RimJ/RimL family n=1 Tax=Hymenobacter psychrophilus TaxID=651662 RepID=A0A1H3GPD5_9BACT|nr:GNAT family N-acetyltransferase [Hymenobacter psychrophilus]SDY04344.1 Protein N-acetyltransferase, RimJ/RimL family [Hymenobacter psychrophilus]
MLLPSFLPPVLVPELGTSRLLLRAFRAEDLPGFTALHQNPDFYRHLGGQPLSEEDTWRRILTQLGHWALLGYGYWALEERATGRFCGAVGLAEYQRGLTPSIDGLPEAGWVLDPRLHGQGYAAEAVTAALAWADAHLAAPRTVCIIDPENGPSLRLAARFGYREIARPTYHHKPIVLLERRAGE